MKFNYGDVCYLFLYDIVQEKLISMGYVINSRSWMEKGGCSWGGLSKDLLEIMREFKI